MSEKIDLSKVISGWNWRHNLRLGICNWDSSGHEEVRLGDYLNALREAVVGLQQQVEGLKLDCAQIQSGMLRRHSGVVGDLGEHNARLVALESAPCSCKQPADPDWQAHYLTKPLIPADSAEQSERAMEIERACRSAVRLEFERVLGLMDLWSNIRPSDLESLKRFLRNNSQPGAGCYCGHEWSAECDGHGECVKAAIEVEKVKCRHGIDLGHCVSCDRRITFTEEELVIRDNNLKDALRARIVEAVEEMTPYELAEVGALATNPSDQVLYRTDVLAAIRGAE